MTRLLCRFSPLIAISLFAVTLADVTSGFTWLPMWPNVVVALACLVGLSAVARRTGLDGRFVSLTLFAAVFLAVVARWIGYETVVHRTPEKWQSYQQQLALQIADKVSYRFTDLCRRAESAAKDLAAGASFQAAVEEPESRDKLSGAFSALEAAELPRSLAQVVSGATLYDGWHNPLAWVGDNVELGPYFEAGEARPASDVFILERGVFVYLVVVQPIPSGQGSVSLEIPLAARRRLNNRYQSDYEAVEAWAQKSLVTDYVDVREEAPELAKLFERSGDRYWGGTRDAPMLYFALRSPNGEVLAVSSLAAEHPPTAVVEHRLETQRWAGALLSLAVLVIVIGLAQRRWQDFQSGLRGGRSALIVGLYFGAASWGLRIVVFFANVPLGFGTDADNPAYYASNLFFHLFRSPVDFLATTLVGVASTAALVLPVLCVVAEPPVRRGGILRPLVIRLAASASVLTLVVLTNGIIRNTWINSNLPLSLVSLGSPDPPRLAIQLGLLFVFLTTTLLGLTIFSVAERRSGATSRSFSGLLKSWAWDVVVFIGFYTVLLPSRGADWLGFSLVPLLSLELLAFLRGLSWKRLQDGTVYWRFAAALTLLVVSSLSFYPAIAFFEERSTHQFIESTVARAVLHHGDSRNYILLETLEAIDRMELAGRLSLPERADLAFQLWSGSGLSMSAMSSSIEVYDSAGALVSRFALNFPSLELGWNEPSDPDEGDWIIWEDPYPGESRPRVVNAVKSLERADGESWDVRVRLVADWSNLPFVSTPNPYIDVFRSPGTEAPLPSPHAELTLHVFEHDGKSIFGPSRDELTVSSENIRRAGEGPLWVEAPLNEQDCHILYFSDANFVYALSYPAKKKLGYAAEFVGWAVFSTLAAAGLWLISLAVLLTSGSGSLRVRAIWTDIGASFYGKLFVAFIFLALVPTVFLAVMARGIVVQQLQLDVEQEAVARARVVEGFVRDYLLYERSERGAAAVDDQLLEWVGSLVDADVDLYSRGRLVATSKRELFAAGLLSARAVPTVYGEIVLDRVNHSIHRQSVGSFQYLVVSVPIALERWREPGILSLPLASRQREIERQVAALNQTVLLAAIFFALLAAFLAYSLARRIAEPINTLTAATRRVAQGDFDVSIRAPSEDEIGALSTSFNQMTLELQRQRTDLERTKKLEAWAEMARQVAHDVKNPLTPIQLSAEHLLRVFGDPRVDFKRVLKNCTDTILQQVRTLRQISMEFSTFASPSPLQPETTDFGRLVTQTLEPYRQAPPAGVTIEIDVAPSLPRMAVDRRLIQRTLINLIENALYAMNGVGRVTVIVTPVHEEGRDWVEVAVSDTGEGIDPEIRDRVFEPFFSTRVAGTGLGLAIARKAVEEHGGTISLESDPGKGTRVLIRLPMGSET